MQNHEFLDLAWEEPQLKFRANNLLQAIHLYKFTSNWVSQMILHEKALKVRAMLYTRFVEIADVWLYHSHSHLKQLCTLNNFSTCFAIIGGLNHKSVERLENTQALIKKSKGEVLKVSCSNSNETQFFQRKADLNILIDPKGGYQHYRTCLNDTAPPAIPHLDVALKELITIEKENRNTVDGLINFRKRYLTHGVIRSFLSFFLFWARSSIQKFQVQPYNMQTCPNLQSKLKSHYHPCSDDQLMSLSKDLEPSVTHQDSL